MTKFMVNAVYTNSKTFLVEADTREEAIKIATDAAEEDDGFDFRFPSDISCDVDTELKRDSDLELYDKHEYIDLLGRSASKDDK